MSQSSQVIPGGRICLRHLLSAGTHSRKRRGCIALLRVTAGRPAAPTRNAQKERPRRPRPYPRGKAHGGNRRQELADGPCSYLGRELSISSYADPTFRTRNEPHLQTSHTAQPRGCVHRMSPPMDLTAFYDGPERKQWLPLTWHSRGRRSTAVALRPDCRR
jgi:hypothetical protein